MQFLVEINNYPNFRSFLMSDWPAVVSKVLRQAIIESNTINVSDPEEDLSIIFGSKRIAASGKVLLINVFYLSEMNIVVGDNLAVLAHTIARALRTHVSTLEGDTILVRIFDTDHTRNAVVCMRDKPPL